METMETFTPATQIEQNLELLSNQREDLLNQLEIHPPGSTEFASIAQQLVSIKSQLENQTTALAAQRQLDKSEAERQVEAEQARQAVAAAAAQALTAAQLERDELLKSWATLAAQLKAAIVAWNMFAATDQAALLRQQNAYPNAAGSYSSQNWDRMICYPKQRPDGGWTLFLNRDQER